MAKLPVDSVFAQLKSSGAAPVRGGTMDIDVKGSIAKQKGAPVMLSLPFTVTMRDTTFAIAGAKETKIESLSLPLSVSGPATRPSIRIEDKALAEALTNAGKQELANFVNAQAGKLLGGIPQLDGVLDANKSVQENVDAAKQRAEEEAKKALDQAKQQAEAEAQKAIDAAKLKAEEAAKKALEDAAKKAAEDAAKKAAADKLKGGLKGLIPGGGKKDGV
jgi:colicin import membrane protein